MSMEQLAQMGVDESAYVWHSGLPDWVRITNVPELKEMLKESAQTLIKQEMAIEYIADKEKLKYSKEEKEDEIKEICKKLQ